MFRSILFLSMVLMVSCSLPDPVRLSSAVSFEDYRITADSFLLTLRKDIPGPVQVNLSSDQEPLATALDSLSPIVLTDSLPAFPISLMHALGDTSGIRQGIQVSGTYGDPFAVWDTSLVYAWPFPKGRWYKIIQGYNGTFSHDEVSSRYAIDFSLSVGDTVCAAQDGLVMSILQGNTIGGKTRKYRPYANYITLYHADGLLTQYVHLAPNSALVEAGDRVKKGQAIALSGETGFASGAHLHFNVYRPGLDGTKSAPVLFEKAAGKDLKKGMRVSH